MGAQTGFLGAIYVTQKNCLQFDAVGEKVEVADNSLLDFVDDALFSVEIWARIPANAGAEFILRKYVGGVGYSIELVATGEVKVDVDDGVNNPTITGGTAVDDDAWHHIMFVRGATQLHLYIDGASDAVAVNDTSLDLSNAAAFSLGATSNGNTMYIGMVRMVDVETSAADAAKLAAGNMPEDFQDDLVLWWGFELATGAILYDIGPNQLNGTITNATWNTAALVIAVAGETPSGAINGVNTTYALANPYVDDIGMVVVADGTTLIQNQYSISPSGALELDTAPAATLVVDYNYWPLLLECGGFTNWSVTEECEELETTSFSDTVKKFIPGIVSWSATASKHWLSFGLAPLLQNGSKVVLKFFVSEDNSVVFIGWAHVKSVSPTSASDVLVEEAVSFTGTNKLSRA